jgi:hypothetical protein
MGMGMGMGMRMRMRIWEDAKWWKEVVNVTANDAEG